MPNNLLNPKLNIDIYKAQVFKRVQLVLDQSMEIDFEDMDPGNITDLEDIHAVF